MTRATSRRCPGVSPWFRAGRVPRVTRAAASSSNAGSGRRPSRSDHGLHGRQRRRGQCPHHHAHVTHDSVLEAQRRRNPRQRELDGAPATVLPVAGPQVLHHGDPHPHHHFAWLQPEPGQPVVAVQVLQRHLALRRSGRRPSAPLAPARPGPSAREEGRRRTRRRQRRRRRRRQAGLTAGLEAETGAAPPEVRLVEEEAARRQAQVAADEWRSSAAAGSQARPRPPPGRRDRAGERRFRPLRPPSRRPLW